MQVVAFHLGPYMCRSGASAIPAQMFCTFSGARRAGNAFLLNQEWQGIHRETLETVGFLGSRT